MGLLELLGALPGLYTNTQTTPEHYVGGSLLYPIVGQLPALLTGSEWASYSCGSSVGGLTLNRLRAIDHPTNPHLVLPMASSLHYGPIPLH